MDFKSSGRTDAGQDVNAFSAPEISLQEQTEHIAGIIANALEATQMVEVKETQANLVNQVHLLCRVKEKHTHDFVHKVAFPIIEKTAAAGGIEVFIGKQLLVKDNRRVYAWICSFASDNVKRMAQVVCAILEESATKKRIEVVESPLMGPGTPASKGPGSRGAAPVKAG